MRVASLSLLVVAFVACSKQDQAALGQIPYCILRVQQVYLDLVRSEKPPVSEATKEKHWSAVENYYMCALPPALKDKD